MSERMCDNEEDAREAIKNFTLALELLEKPPYWETWGYGMAMVTATAFAAALAFMLVPFISLRVYNRLLTFLIALGVGNLTGCTLFVLFPRAFHISELGTSDYIIKSWMLLGGCYLVFVFEKLMTFFGEVKKKFKARSSQGSGNRISVVQEQMPQVETTPESKIPDGSTTPNGHIPADHYSQILSVSQSVTPQTTPMKVANNDHIVTHVSPRNHKNHQHDMHHHQPTITAPINEGAIENELQSEAMLALLGGWANNFIDGMVIGVSFGDSAIRGITIGIAILSQQFPNEVDSLVIVMRTGVGLKRAMLLNLVQAVLSYIGFVIAVFIDNKLEQFNTFLYAIAAGNYLYICLGCLVPEMSEKVVESVKVCIIEGLITTTLQFLGIVIGLVFMFYMALDGNDITTAQNI